jgi:putative Holliday junction resolvase
VSRIVGVDLGERRVGLAISDPTGTLASPLRTLERTGDPVADRRAILAAARDAGASRIVVGLPLALSGSAGPAARAVMAEVEALREEAAALPTARAGAGACDGDPENTDEAEGSMVVVTHDERLTTVIAEQHLRDADVGARKRRRRVDAEAATVILQSYLESNS